MNQQGGDKLKVILVKLVSKKNLLIQHIGNTISCVAKNQWGGIWMMSDARKGESQFAEMREVQKS